MEDEEHVNTKEVHQMRRSVLLLLAAGSLASCRAVTPGPGEEAVLTRYPIVFGSGGVVDSATPTGRNWVWITTTPTYVDIRPQQFSMAFEDIMSSDGVPLDFNAVIRLQVTNSVRLIEGFGGQWFDQNVAIEFQNRVRQAVRQHGMNETAISTEAIDDIDAEVTAEMETYLLDAALPLRLIQVTVGRANPPDAVESQRVETATQQQRQLTENERRLAEDARLAAEQSRALADNAYRNSLGLSPAQFVALQEIEMQREVCASETSRCVFVPQGALVNVAP